MQLVKNTNVSDAQCDYTLKEFVSRFNESDFDKSKTARLVGKPQFISRQDHNVILIHFYYTYNYH